MNDKRMSNKNREDELERILAETARSPYTSQKTSPQQNTKKSINKPVSDLDNASDITKRPLTEAQKAEEARARAAKKIEEIRYQKKMREIAEQNAQKKNEPIKNSETKMFAIKKNHENDEIAKIAKNEVKIRKRPVEIQEPVENNDELAEKAFKLNDVLDIVETFLAVMLVITMLFTYVIRIAVVDGESMVPTLEENDKLIVRAIGYTPENGDVVIVDNEKTHLISEDGKVIEGDGLEKIIVKRVIATGGQTIDINFETGEVTVDGKILEESYINALTTRDEYAFTYPLTIPDGYIFAMGDNRNISKDSRHPEIGLIPEDNVLGKVILRIYPFDKFGGIE